MPRDGMTAVCVQIDLGGVLPSTPEQTQSAQQGVRIGTEPDGLHRVGRVAPATAVTYSATHGGQ